MVYKLKRVTIAELISCYKEQNNFKNVELVNEDEGFNIIEVQINE